MNISVNIFWCRCVGSLYDRFLSVLARSRALHIFSSCCQISFKKKSMIVSKKSKQHLLVIPGSPAVRTQHFCCKGLGSVPGWGTKLHGTSCMTQPKKFVPLTSLLILNTGKKNFLILICIFCPEAEQPS